MVKRGKLRLSFIADKAQRKQTFHKRKKGLMKKLNELMTLCDVQACAVVTDPFTQELFVGPSRQGVQEVVSRFAQLPRLQQTMRMRDHEGYLKDRIREGEARGRKLREGNVRTELRQCLFDFLSGKRISSHGLDPQTACDLLSFAEGYLKELKRRIPYFSIGEGSPSPAPLPVGGDADGVTAPSGYHDPIQHPNMNMNHMQYQPFQSQAYFPPSAANGVPPLAVSNADTVSTAFGFSDPFQYRNQQEPVHYHAAPAPAPVASMVPSAVTGAVPLASVTAPPGFHNHIHYSNMNMNRNQYGSFQQYPAYVPPSATNATPLAVTTGETVTTPFGFSDPFFQYRNQYQQPQYYPPAAYMVPPPDRGQYQGLVQQYQAPVGFYDQTQQMNYGMHPNQNMNLGFNQNQNWNQQQMDNVGEHAASIPTVSPNNYPNQQPPLPDNATTNHKATTVVNEYTQKLKGIAYN